MPASTDDTPPCVILIVEDDPNDAFLIKRAFERATEGLEIVIVSSVDEGIEYLQRGAPIFRPPVVILQDIKMPMKPGFDLLSWIKGHPALKRVPVIMLTASEAEPDINRAYELGASSYLVKPTPGEELTAMMKTLDAYWVRYNRRPSL